jgi:hypothetical protein
MLKGKAPAKPLPRKKGKAQVGKFPTKFKNIAALRERAWTRKGRNFEIARTIIRELARPLQKQVSDRSLARRLGVDHRTIGRWRERLSGNDRPRKEISKRSFLAACRKVALVDPKWMWGELTQRSEIVEARRALAALHRVLHGERTLPKRPSRRRRVP